MFKAMLCLGLLLTACSDPKEKEEEEELDQISFMEDNELTNSCPKNHN